MKPLQLIISLILLITPLSTLAEEITGLGEIKIGSTQQQVRMQMSQQNIKPTEYFSEEGSDNYIGWSADQFENVEITKNITIPQIILFYHNDYLYLIQASDEDGSILEDVYQGFNYKYGSPKKSEQVVVLDNEVCGNNLTDKVKQVQETYTFNHNSNIQAKAWKASEYNNRTGQKCPDSVNKWSNFLVSDSKVETMAIKLSLEYEANEEKNYLKNKYDGL